MKDIEKHLMELKERINSIESSKDKSKRKERELESLKNRISKINPIEEKLVALEKKISFEMSEQLNRNLSEFDKDFNRIHETTQELKKKLETFEDLGVDKKLKVLEEGINSLSERLEKIESLNPETDFAKVSDLEKVNLKVESLNTHLESFESSINLSKENISKLKELVGALQGKIDTKIHEGVVKIDAKVEERLKNNMSEIQKSFSELEEVRGEVWEIVKNIQEFKEAVDNNFKTFENKENDLSNKLNTISSSFSILENKLNGEISQRLARVEENADFFKGETYDLDKRIEKYNNSLEEHYVLIKRLKEDLESLSGKIYSMEKTQKESQDSISQLEQKEEELRINTLWAHKFREEFEELKNKVEKDLVALADFDKVKAETDKVWERLSALTKLEAQIASVKETMRDLSSNIHKINAELSQAKSDIKTALEKSEKLPSLEEQEKQTDIALSKYKEIFEKRDAQLIEYSNKLENLMGKIFSLESNQEKLKDSVEELKSIEKELNESLAEIKKLELTQYKDKLKDLEKTKAGKIEVDRLKQAFETTKQKNAELIEMLLEKIGV